MALSDLKVFEEYAQTGLTEVLDQNVEVFNAASRGTIVLKSASHMGDYSEKSFFGSIAGLVRTRNPYGSGAVSAVKLKSLVDNMIRIAKGTPPVEMDPGQFDWIKMNPKVAGAALGQQLAVATLKDMVNTAAMGAYAAMSNITDTIYDGTTDSPDTPSLKMLAKGAAKFGDRFKSLSAWLMHSQSFHAIFQDNLTNTSNLFKFETVNIIQDALGNVYVMTDSPVLYTAGTPNVGRILGLVPGAIQIDQNADFRANIETTNGDENIGETYQSQWSYNLGITGFAWDKANGGVAPNDAALAVQTNWDYVNTSVKDGPGVMVIHN